MYIPKLNEMTNRQEALDFIQRFSFGTIVSSRDGKPLATHLPFLIEERGENLLIKSHFAKTNDQWQDLEKGEVLIIFSEPHAYISPRHYEKQLNVPTWNYLAVHAYGNGKIVSETSEVMDILEQTIHQFEEAYRSQWDSLPDEYKLGMIKGIVAFEVEVTDLQAKKKLSQNKTEAEQHRIIEHLSASSDTNEQLIAEYMKAL